MLPPKLCSTSWRLLVLPSNPASTLGLAAASITQSPAPFPGRWRCEGRHGTLWSPIALKATRFIHCPGG